jgi:hypothetical protein
MVIAARGERQRAWLRSAASGEDTMKFKAIAVTAAATMLSLGLAGTAMAAPLGPAKAAPQVTGTRLQSALLPASAFGAGFSTFNRHNSGSALRSTQAVIRPSGLSCANFESYIYYAGFGNTAGALDSVNNSNPNFSDYPSLVLGGDQYVLQFSNTAAAQSFYNRAYTRYKQCSALNEPAPAFQTHVELTTQSLSSTTIGGHHAFQLIQHADYAAFAGFDFYFARAIVLVGTNVYTIDNIDGTNDPISASLVDTLISRVQALYKR